ncbi:LIM domain only protein 7 isoform X2 [Periophthalmus magnuspinnatus]|uniref:LIM domain only protein 7 isoform X2 n=1 Tax=Periophthalmus magnuspinnatus TaxID=409849 RepID=UPI0024368BE0|nr:LIM domain only protein 7 isoform X2 [Periophthalmus magnuspinnatus]
MEWREQSTVSCDEAYLEAQRWIEAVTKKKFGSSDFRSALENGVLLCDLINGIKPGIIRRVNRLPTPIAGLDNLNVFLRACGKLGLKEAQLFHPGDLQDLSTRVTVKAEETSRRLKNVLITIYWLGRRAQCDPVYNGPYLNLKAFEGLLGTALYKALHESSSTPQKDNSILRDSGFGESWYSEQEDLHHFRGGGGGHRRDDSLDSLDSLGSRPHSISSDIKGSSEGFCSDTEQDLGFRMTDRDNLSYRRSAVVAPKTTTQFNQFLPSKDKATGYVPAPLRKKRAERNDDNRRSLTSPYIEEEAPLTSQLPGEDSLDGSKSTSDIDMEQSIARQVRYEELQKYREAIKQSDDKWQDDLSKWKSRRKSVNSDIVKKKEEREKIEEITYGSNRKSKTFKEMQEDRENKRQSLGSRLGSLSFGDDEDVFDRSVSTQRARYGRSNTIDTPRYSSSSYSRPVLKDEEPSPASTATGRASSPTPSKETVNSDTVPSTITSTRYSSYQRSPSPPATQPSRLQTVETEKTTTTTTSTSLKSEPRAQEPKSLLLPSKTEVPSVESQFKRPQQQIPMEPKPPVVSRVSASLPRTYQGLDSARLTSVIAPRPFGTQATRLSSLPRANTTDASVKPLNGDTSKKSSVPSRYHQFMTSEDEAQSSSAHSSDEEEEEEEVEDSAKKSSTSPTPAETKSETAVRPAPVKDNSEEDFCEMRISLNQKPNSSRDFGFQAAWDSTGARVTTIAPGSPAEMCQLQTGDEVLTVNGHQVAGMSYTSWKTHIEEALQEGSLVMDIKRHGKNNWNRDQTSLPYKSHKTINLTSTDHPLLLGAPDAKTVSSSLDFTSHISAKPEPVKDTFTHQVIDVASNGLNGNLWNEPVTMRNKDSEPISLKNLKRRSEFFEQGGSDPVMPDIPVPPITTTSSRWSFDPEEERKRQEKWQKEQDRLLQEKYKRDQEKLQEEWLKAQQEISSTQNQQQPASLDVNNQSTGPRSPLLPVSQPLSSLWEEQERERKEEQERRRQAEERELQRLREERLRREQQEEEERKRREEEEIERKRRIEEEERERKRRAEEERRREEEERERRRAEEERIRQEEVRRREEEERERRRRAEEEKRRQEEVRRRRAEEAAEQLRRERERILEIQQRQQQQQQQWAGGFHARPTMTFADSRTRSKSSPQLDDEQRTQPRVMGNMVAQKYQQSASQAELERQQILNEMKKKTPLLTDNSWIRQRSSTTTTSSTEHEVAPMRRGESLDNLDSHNYNSWRSSWTPRTNSQIPHYLRPQSAMSGSTSSYGGWSGGLPRSSTLPSSSSLSSLRGGAGTPSVPWSRQTPSPSLSSPSPTTSPEPLADSQQRNRSVSGKKICTYCDTPLGKGAAMIIESLGLCYHLGCFKCFDCGSNLGGSEIGAEVRIRNKHLYCNNCYVRFKTAQPTSM